MSFTPHSYCPIMKQKPTVGTSPDHHLTLSEEKMNTRLNALSTTDVMNGLESFNILSSGKGILKVTIRGNWQNNCMLQIY